MILYSYIIRTTIMYILYDFGMEYLSLHDSFEVTAGTVFSTQNHGISSQASTVLGISPWLFLQRKGPA